MIIVCFAAYLNAGGARIARPCGLSPAGIAVEDGIKNIPLKYPHITLDKYVIMPNHIHLILIINADNGRAMRAPTISTVVNQFKGYVTKTVGFPIWQKLFYDHIIRDNADYLRIWQYIDENPLNWTQDEYYST